MPEPGQPLNGSNNGAADAVHVRGLVKSFDGVPVLKGVTLRIGAGEVHGLVGANGSGKSTLIKVLSGFYKYDLLEEFFLGGEEHRGPDFRVIAAKHFAFVHQDRCLVPSLSIAENCSLTMGTPKGRLGQIDRKAEYARVRAVLDSVGISADPSAPLSSLGPAEATLLSIGRAVASIEPGEGSLLVLDEPTTALPESEVGVVLSTIRRIAATGTAVLFVSHRLSEIIDACDVVSVLRDGTLVGDRIPAPTTSPDVLVELMLGRSLERESHRRAQASTESEPVLSVHQVSGPNVRDISLDLHPGEIIGITGLVGCGKSELGRLVTGEQRRAGGAVAVAGALLPSGSPGAAVSAGMAYVPPGRLINGSLPEMSAFENLTLPDLKTFVRLGRLVGGLEVAETASWMQRTGTVPAQPRQAFRNFSGGNQQKIVLAKWLRLNPRVLLIDEPTQGVDVGAKEDLYRLIGETAANGTGVIIISSEAEEVARLATRALVIDRGAVVADIRGDEISTDSISEAIFTGRQLAS